MCRGLAIGLGTAALLVLSGSALAVTPAQKCAAAKLKEAGKYGFCRAKAEAKAVRTGDAADFARCDEKLLSSWSAIEADGGGDCPTLGDGPDIQDSSTLHTAEIARTIRPAGSCLDAPSACVSKTLWVAPGALGGSNVDCASAAYATIQDAIDAAATANALLAGSITTINVCPGVYDESPMVDVPNLAIRGVGAEPAIIQPTTPRLGAIQRAESGVLVAVTPIVWVRNFAGGTSLSHLVIGGFGLLDSPIGVYFDYDAGPPTFTGSVEDVVISRCASGVQVASTLLGPVGAADVSVTDSLIVGSSGSGIVCVGGASVTCTLADNTLANGGSGTGVMFLAGAAGSIRNNRILGGSVGVMLAAAGYHYGSPVTLDPTEVRHNVLTASQTGVSLALSAAVISDNTITVDAAGVGIYGVAYSALLVPPPFYGIGLGLLDALPADQPVTVASNRIVCSADAATAEGIWMGEDLSPGEPWSIAVTAADNYFGPGLDLRIDPGAHL